MEKMGMGGGIADLLKHIFYDVFDLTSGTRWVCAVN